MAVRSPNKHTITLPKLSAAGLKKGNGVDLDAVNVLFEKLNQTLESGNLDSLKALFCEDAWVRDFLTLSWDFRTIQGADKIKSYLGENSKRIHLHSVWPRKAGAYAPRINIPEAAARVEWAETIIDFETDIGKGSGMVRMITDAQGRNLIYAMSLFLQELKGHEDKIMDRRPHGGNNSLPAGSGNWQERRDRGKDFVESDPAVLVIGAGERNESMVPKDVG